MTPFQSRVCLMEKRRNHALRSGVGRMAPATNKASVKPGTKEGLARLK
jgi:hypothetical protein